MISSNSFVDTEGHTWTFNIGPRIAATVRGEGMDLANSDFLLKLVDDPISRIDLAWALVKSTAANRGVDLDRFDANVIEVWDQLSAALFFAVSTYLDRMGRKASAESLRKALAAQAKLEAAAIERMNSPAAIEYESKVMAKAEAAMDKAIGDVMDEAFRKLEER